MPFCIKCHHRLYPMEENQDSEICRKCRFKEIQDKHEKESWIVDTTNATNEKLVLMSIPENEPYTGNIYKNYIELCKKYHRKPVTIKRVTQILSKQENLIGTIKHNGMAGRTREWRKKLDIE